MPNWSQNKITMYFGDQTEFESFIQKSAGQEEALFDAFLPTPEEALDGTGWWLWRIDNWGTKWNPKVYALEIDTTSRQVTIECDTAWNPPREFLIALSHDYPNLEIELAYLEEGMGFCGNAYIELGAISDQYLAEIPKEMYLAAGYKLENDGEIDYYTEGSGDLFALVEDQNEFAKYYSANN